MNLYKKPLYDVKKMTDIKDLLNSSAAEFADRKAFLVKCDGQYMPITYRQFKADVDAFGTALLSLGLKGKKIAVIGENRYEWAVAYMAVVCGAGIVVPLDKELPEGEIAPLIELAELEAVIFSPKTEAAIKNSNIACKINMEADMQALIKKGRALLESGRREFVDAAVDPDALGVLLFTSGTTSASKAVMLSHKNIVANIMSMLSMVYVDTNDVLLSVLPLHHTYECTCGFLAPIARGCTIAYCEGLRHVTKNMCEAKVTLMLCVPLLAENMLKRIWQQAKKNGKENELKKGIKFSNFLLRFGVDIREKAFAEVHENLGGHLKRIISGAAGIDPEIAAGLRALGINLIQGYGLTECAPIGAVNRFEYFKDASAGLPMPGVTIKIDRPNADGIGEILIKGDNVMLGYYKNEDATNAVLKNGFFHTGDLGYMDDEGFVYITGREKNVIVTKNGKNIYPEELETYLARSAYVHECMVYGDDSDSGDTIVCVQIIPDFDELEAAFGRMPAASELQKLMEDEVLKVNHRFQNYKRISRVIIRHEEFAKTTTQKIKRHVEIGRSEAV